MISFISTRKADIPSLGLSAENVLSMKASVKGTVAFSTGANRPQAASTATAHVLRRMVDFPAMFGPVFIGQA